MIVYPNEREPIAQLLRFLAAGERLTHECAAAQAGLAGERAQPDLSRFLHSQARQELAHMVVFQAVIGWLSPRSWRRGAGLVPLDRYRRLLESAIQRREFLETVLAEQVILEGLGEAILGRIEAGLVKRGAGFGRLRRLLLQQETAHHTFGEKIMARAVTAGETSYDALRLRAQPYLALVEPMVVPLAHLFDEIDEDPAAYLADARTCLPDWLRP
jgi:hypothetical protein